MLKLICAAMLSLTASAALAADNTNTNIMTYHKMLGTAMVTAVCNAKTQPTLEVGADGSINEIYNASTEDLHRCQYINEMIASGCVLAENCQGYEDWTRANTAIWPALPREAFLGSPQKTENKAR